MTVPSIAPLVFADLQVITRQDAASGFRCESEALNGFFRQYASQQGRKEANRTWVLHRPDDRPDLPLVLGFYTLASSQVEREHLPSAVVNRLPHYPIQAILLGRLARDERCKGMGVGEHLLDDAHRRALLINAQIGGLLVIVDAKDERAATFYEDHGYAPLTRAEAGLWPRRLYLKMADLRASYAGS